VALAGVGVAWMWIDRKRRTESLTALAEAVRDIENPATRRMVKEKVKEKTRDRGVGGYFDTFLEKRELRIEKEKVPVPALVGGDGDGPVAPAGAP
ncbi:MAG TPA: hypothetical protein VFQ39_08070, partial [Longimicrobium sp.]|nr:hypothetical protein [Longimicrobium sp.]